MSERIELTESDRKFLEHAVSCLKAPLEVDLTKIATRLGIKPKSASNKWAEVKKKIMHNSSLDDAEVPPSPATDGGDAGEVDELAGTATPAKKRKRAAASATPKTPRKPRTPRKSKKEVKDEEPENDVKDEEEGDVKGEEGDDVAGEV